MLSALSHDLAVLAIAEKRIDIPSLLQISADLSLETGKLDRKFVADLVEVIYPGETIETLGLPSDSDARWLSLEDLVLASVPGGMFATYWHVLATLIERYRRDFDEEGPERDESDGDASGSGSSKTATEKEKGSDAKQKPSNTENSGRWKKDKPSGPR